ncbi:MAG TPA: HemK2/MTQ2 family protein methyltransferase [Thermoplasmata archaeon]|nr:HemK2/MTQ2 family protein methyltransferase [Thermoplasmata archaeon]
MTVEPAGGSTYPVREDSLLLLPFAAETAGLRFLEIGCGMGTVSLAAARAGARVLSTDLNPRALRVVRDRARAEGLDVEVVRTDLAHGLGLFDRIVANPPYLPTPPGARDPDRWVDLALNGGPDGLAVTRRLFDEIPAHLSSSGRGFLLVSSRQSARGLDELLARARRFGQHPTEVASRWLGDERLTILELHRGGADGAAPG